MLDKIISQFSATNWLILQVAGRYCIFTLADFQHKMEKEEDEEKEDSVQLPLPHKIISEEDYRRKLLRKN